MTSPRPGGDAKKAPKCAGNLIRTALGHWYITDTVQIDPGVMFGYEHMLSLLAALLNAVDTVGIAQSDVLGSVSPHVPVTARS